MPVVIHLETSVELSLVMHVHLFLEGVFCSLAKAVSSIKGLFAGKADIIQTFERCRENK